MQAVGKTARNKRAHIKNQIVEYIRREQLGPGAPLPSQNELARELRVTPLTTHRAMGELAAEGVLYRVRGKGSFVGSGPASRENGAICLVLPGVNMDQPANNPTHWEYVQRLMFAFMEAVGTERTFSTLAVPYDQQPEEQVQRFASDSIVFFLNVREYAPLAELLLKRPRAAVASLGGAVEGLDCLSLGYNRSQGCALGAEHLLAAGYRRIAYLSNDLPWEQNDYRGYCQALAAAGLPADRRRVVTCGNEVQPALFVREVGEILKHGADAICVGSDALALQLIDYLGQVGVAVPAEVAVLGFDGLPSATSHPPYLTSIAPPYAELIRAALAAVDGQPKAAWLGRHIELPCKVVLGRTVGQGRFTGDAS